MSKKIIASGCLIAAGVAGVLGWRFFPHQHVSAAEAPVAHVVRAPSMIARALQAAAARAARPMMMPQPAADPDDTELVWSFDDGPDQDHTGAVLDLLAKHHFHAVFFVNGKNLVGDSETARQRRALLQRELREGNLVGNHTFSHVHLCTVPVDQGEHEIAHGEDAIVKVSGRPSSLFRTPYGDHCARAKQLLKAAGLSHTRWDIDAQEWKTHSADTTVKRIEQAITRAHGRTIVLMHDIQPATIGALPKILTWVDQQIAARAKQKHGRLTVAEPSVLLGQVEVPPVAPVAATLASLAAAVP